MKTFQEHHGQSVEDSSSNIADVADPKVLKRINAFVGSIADREYLNANHAIAELRQKIARIGLSFPKVEIYEGDGEISVPLTQWGGALNAIDGTSDDGISNRVDGGLSINFKYEELNNGTCKVYAKIA
jgi:hypothetical protein|tara:strand:- start:179 stop:562 length:384 start_codon:yes stop_codon:yes gene_type:complete